MVLLTIARVMASILFAVPAGVMNALVVSGAFALVLSASTFRSLSLRDGAVKMESANQLQSPATMCKGTGEISKHLPIDDRGTVICPMCNTPPRPERVGEATLICEHPATQLGSSA